MCAYLFNYLLFFGMEEQNCEVITGNKEIDEFIHKRKKDRSQVEEKEQTIDEIFEVRL